ncbi:MAG TPA: heme-binding protein, partial [Methylomirabilota bacterium]|nr:heme-binding protein [Methylomirabilota bacterium]
MRIAKLVAVVALVVASGFGAGPAAAQAPPPYGTPISLDQARKALAAAEAEARKNSWNVVIAVVDSGGNLVVLQRMDSTQFGSVEVARQKAFSAAAFRRPTKVFEDAIAGGGAGLRILGLAGATPLEGGFPIVVEGRIVGAIGVSGVTGQQDAQVARAGADALKSRSVAGARRR